jgi:hypothetical protein
VRRVTTYLLVLALAPLVAACASPGADDAQSDDPGTNADGAASVLFVQTCSSGTYDGKTLTLNGVGPTLYFSDRPERIEGHLRTSRVIANWAEGENSFASDPPNAVLSAFGNGNVANVTVELSEPRLTDGNLTYDVKVLDGSVPGRFAEASLFIDNIRMRGGRRRRGMVYGDQDFHDLGSSGQAPPQLGFR